MSPNIRAPRFLKDKEGHKIQVGDEVLFTRLGVRGFVWRNGTVVGISAPHKSFAFFGPMADIVADGETSQDQLYVRFGVSIKRR